MGVNWKVIVRFNLYFLHYQQDWSSFRRGPLCFLWEMSLYEFCPFFCWIFHFFFLLHGCLYVPDPNSVSVICLYDRFPLPISDHLFKPSFMVAFGAQTFLMLRKSNLSIISFMAVLFVFCWRKPFLLWNNDIFLCFIVEVLNCPPPPPRHIEAMNSPGIYLCVWWEVRIWFAFFHLGNWFID